MPNILRPFSETRIVVVDDDAIIREILCKLLEDEFIVEAIEDSSIAMAHCSAQPPDLILLDVNMPKVSGLDVCREMRKLEAFKNTPIVFVTGNVDLDSQNACWEAGASDFISKPIAASTLIHRVKNHITNKLRYEQLEKLTYKDSLTDLFNRHFLNENVDSIINQAKRFKEPLGLLMLDVDHFKSYNDVYGHQMGDSCLKSVAYSIMNTLNRPQDVAVRFGGEEFLVLLPFTDKKGIAHFAEQIIKNLTDLDIAHSNSSIGRVSISVGGVACHSDNIGSLSTLIKAADRNLYQAKSDGRNQSVISEFN